tara:strand:+ start:119 stop:1021 length:903 start_codon:yes stop_codon:yes gene_type:complete
MGGRLDATNILDNVLASIITPIAIDHAEFLGETLEEIAYEKSGIIKDNSTVFCAKQDDKALEVIKNFAQQKSSQFFNFGNYYSYNAIENEFVFSYNFDENKKGNLKFSLPKFLHQKHQLENLSNALALCFQQELLPLDKDKVNLGITNAKWSARMELINDGLLYQKISKAINMEKFRLFLDGGHNVSAAKAIQSSITKEKHKIFIFAMLPDKDCRGFLSQIKDSVDFLISCEIENSTPSMKNQDIINICEDLDINNISSNSIEGAIDNAISYIEQNSIENPDIIICGSLYLAGNFIEKNK